MEPGVPRASWVIVVQWSEEGLRGTFQKQGNEDRTVEESISGLLKKDSSLHEIENVTFHHEGFFWRCWFNGIVEENDSNIWQFWYTNQPLWKNCTHAYLSPYPFLRGEHNSTSYDSAVSVLFALVVMLYVIWVQAVADLESYRHRKMRDCLDFSPSVLYGWSFFLAPAGIFFSLLAGLLFLIVGRHIQIHH
ncbi:transmembrane protein 182 isoform X3 [Bos indicus x Bos taurus]|uniref:transmembrane protein 182 isoform X4 n=1 Tax=Bos taurus TaxID=9913 RepID=UPI000383ECDB|nr:transmembrane protein 182 isoform X4 [Bos taurus]XP_027410581.1 transmembrane protein 182 isoform X3 [Bos indicus x Bos taurus]